MLACWNTGMLECWSEAEITLWREWNAEEEPVT